MNRPPLSFIDKALLNCDRVLRQLHGKDTASKNRSELTQTQASRPTPEVNNREENNTDQSSPLSEQEKQHAAGLMRVNHTGEVMAQALYKGQALTAKGSDVQGQMEEAAQEEEDHLAWCEERISELGGKTSATNPLWYGLSFGLGAVAGVLGDKVSLGFVAAIEDQVCEHLESHLEKLPEEDKKSRAIVTQMLEDEARHSQNAKDAGGMTFPAPVKKGMTVLSRLMTESSYRI